MASIFQYFGLLNQVQKLIATFPGIENRSELRIWIIEQADGFAPLAAKTPTQIDDRIIFWVKTIALKERAFGAIYSLLLLGYEMLPRDPDETTEPIFGAESGNLVAEILDDVTNDGEESNPGDILTIIAAIGLMIQVIRLLRERKNAGS